MFLGSLRFLRLKFVLQEGLPVFRLQEHFGMLLCCCGLSTELLRASGVHRIELRSKHVFVRERLSICPSHHYTATLQLLYQVETIEAGRDEEFILFHDLSLLCEVEIVKSMVNVLVEGV